MYTTVRDSPIHGRGVFATKAIPRGARIFEYTGELITREEEIQRELENDKTGVTYIYQLNDHESVDGAYGGNDSRFVNHSCDPNVEGVIEDGHIYYVALRDIKRMKNYLSIMRSIKIRSGNPVIAALPIVGA